MVERVLEEQGVELDILIGTMIEVPRGALTADRIARHADFFSFGTNDLTQMAFGYSRDDANKFLPTTWSRDPPRRPLRPLDARGWASSSASACEKGRQTSSPQPGDLRRARRRPRLDQLLREGRAWITCRAPPTGSRSPGWPRRGPSWGSGRGEGRELGTERDRRRGRPRRLDLAKDHSSSRSFASTPWQSFSPIQMSGRAAISKQEKLDLRKCQHPVRRA